MRKHRHPPLILLLTVQIQHCTAARKQLQVIAGIVGADGTVKYLPRVQISLMPKSYQVAEAGATAVYKSEMDAASAERETKIAALIQQRRKELDEAQQKYSSELAAAIQRVTITPLQAAPTCVTAFAIIGSNNFFSCTVESKENSVQLSEQFRTFLTSSAILGTFKPDNFAAIRPQLMI